MPQNMEIKARVEDLDRVRLLAERLANAPPQLLLQEDTFFTTPSGRLKLREFAGGDGELIYYERSDGNGPKQSNYLISKTTAPATLKQVLKSAYGIRGVVRKRRELYLAGQTRIHLDEVEGLGAFVELEFVMSPGQTESEGRAAIKNIMGKLEIGDAALVSGAYIDLLLNTGRAGVSTITD